MLRHQLAVLRRTVDRDDAPSSGGEVNSGDTMVDVFANGLHVFDRPHLSYHRGSLRGVGGDCGAGFQLTSRLRVFRGAGSVGGSR